MLAPLVDRVYLDLKTKRVAGIKPKPGFEELLGNAVYRTNESTCALLNRDEVESLSNVGMVETGESGTRPDTISEKSGLSYGLDWRSIGSLTHI